MPSQTWEAAALTNPPTVNAWKTSLRSQHNSIADRVIDCSCCHGGFVLAAVIDPVWTVNPPPVPLFVIQLPTEPEKNNMGDEPVGVCPVVPKLTGAPPALLNFCKFA